MRKTWGVAAAALLCLLVAERPASARQMEIYGAWHCGNDFCTWSTVRNPADFDTKNHWIIDRGDGVPSVNLVVLSFVNPLKLLNRTNDAQTINGAPIGMNSAVVNYFASHNIRVMLSIGGITYTDDWDSALSANGTQLGLNAAALAQQLHVGIEIDYENNTNPNLPALQNLITAYRSVLPYDATGANPAARLTIDLAAGDQYLVKLAAKATTDWLNTSSPVLDYANAMVPNKQPNSASSAESNWQQHISGYPRITPPVPPLAPAKMTASLYIVTGKNPCPECTNFSNSLEKSTGNWVQTVAPAGAGTTPGLLGFMFWAAECQGAHSVCTTPPNTCQGGVGVGSSTYSIPFPMPALRQN
jgi:Glycosyl hydrolases family 18